MDFVLLWVNDKDPKWRVEYEKYSLLETGEKKICRFRDWENLHYWFRGVEKFAPWVDKIFFITANQIPAWMNTEHPKLRLVNHEDYIPQEILPTFSSDTIELFLHKIPDLSEQFVLFNDDFFIINKIAPKRFFRKGLPVDICAMNAYSGCKLSTNSMCNLNIINQHFNKKQIIKTHFFKWFSLHNGKHLVRNFLLVWWPNFVGFYDHHFPQPFLKQTFREIWAKEEDALENSVRLRFRQQTALTQYMFRYWQLLSGRFVCRNICSNSIVYHVAGEKEIDEAAKIIKWQKKSIIVINDSEDPDFNFEKAKEKINQAFEAILPKKSLFEK